MPRALLARAARIALLWLSLLLPAGISSAQSAADRQEARVEAAYLVNFLRYTEWPMQPTADAAPWVIAVVGPNWVAATVRAVAAAAGTVQGRPIQVRTLRLGRGALQPQLHAIDDVHLLFVHGASGQLQRRLLRALRHRPVLTVGAGDNFVAAGGMLGLRRSGEHVVFEANPQAIREAGLVVSAKVLKLARIEPQEPR